MAHPNTKAFLKKTSTRENHDKAVHGINKVDIQSAAKNRSKTAMPGWTGKC